MIIWLKHLDRVIRGEAMKPSALRSGEIEQPVAGLVVIGAILGALYGLCMGSYAIFQKADAPLLQIIATTVKVPVLFFLTLAVTFPSLYVFNALVGSRLSLLSVVRLLVISLTVMLTVLASLGPIVAFFSASTTSYPFMLLLNVVFFAIAGFLGLRCVLITLNRLSIAIAQSDAAETVLPASNNTADPHQIPTMQASSQVTPQATAQPQVTSQPQVPPLFVAQGAAPGVGYGAPQRPAPAQSPRPLSSVEKAALEVKAVFQIWIIVFGVVGAQMAWVLRPFLGSPHHVFTWFRPRSSNFFEAIINAIQHLGK